jgi:hypothetical protein
MVMAVELPWFVLLQNYFAIIPVGPGAWWEEPHDRDEKFPST